MLKYGISEANCKGVGGTWQREMKWVEEQRKEIETKT